MSSMGRIMGHGMGILFMVLGLGFIVAGLSHGLTDWLDTNSTCQYGECSGATSGARTTFLIMGVSFFAGGLLTSVVTEFAIRKTQKVMAQVTTFAAEPHTPENLSEFLHNFGIDVDLSKANINVQQPAVYDLRGLRHGATVPTDPAGLSDYLKSRGVTIDENLLRNASVISQGQIIQSSPLAVRAASSSDPASMFAAPVATSSDAGTRETATIVRKNDRGATAGNQRLLELEIEVTPVGKVPYRVTVASLVRESLAGLLIEGSSLNVRVNPNDKNDVTIDWGEN
ncbi:MAG: hypothetical protein ABI577_18085 [bacterium]